MISTSALGTCPGTPRSGTVGPAAAITSAAISSVLKQQQQPVLQLQPALVLPGGADEIAHSRKDHGGRFTPCQQMQENGDGGRNKPGQHPRMQKTDHAEREGGVKASRSTIPYGVSVVTR